MANSGTSPAKQRVLSFFDAEVSMYILKDIEKLNEIRPDKDGLCGCTVPLALMLFAVVDFFGYLTRDDVNPRKEIPWEILNTYYQKKLTFSLKSTMTIAIES